MPGNVSRRCIAMLGIAMAGMSCSDDQTGGPVLTVEPDVGRPGEVVRIDLDFDGGEGLLLVGETGTELERRNEDQWRAVAHLADGSSETPGRPVVYGAVVGVTGGATEGETTDYSVIPELRPGLYRVAERVSVQREDGTVERELTLTDELRIER